jgi:hypothetical protein
LPFQAAGAYETKPAAIGTAALLGAADSDGGTGSGETSMIVVVVDLREQSSRRRDEWRAAGDRAAGET